MDGDRVAVIIGSVSLITLFAGYIIIVDRWEGIKNPATVALVSGGTCSLTFAGLKIHSGRSWI